MPPEPILFCSHVVEWGGAETVLVDLFAALDRARFLPHLACPGDGPLPARARALGVAVHRVRLGGRGPLTKVWSLPGAARALRALAGSLGARLCYGNTMIAGYAAVLAQHAGLRCLWHVHVVTRSRLAALAARRAATVVTPSRAGAAALGRADVQVIPNGVRDAFFAAGRPAPLRAELGIPADVPLVGIVGRLHPGKGHAVLLRACAALARPFALVVAGGEVFADSQAGVRGQAAGLAALARELGLAGHVHLLGHRDDLPELLRALDVVVVPSTAVESAPRAVAEAQAVGRAVVASDIGGTAEMITDGVTGLLVRPADVSGLGGALRRLLAAPDERRRLGEAARDHARHRYAMPRFARAVEGAMAGALAPRR